MPQRLSILATALRHQAPGLMESLLALSLTGNPLPALTLLATAFSHKDR